MAIKHGVVISSESALRLETMLREYAHHYISSDIKTIVLMVEGFGIEGVKSLLHSLDRVLGIVISQNPLIMLYLPFLMVHGIEGVKPLFEGLSRRVGEMRDRVRREDDRIAKIVLSERRSYLVTLALASKYLLNEYFPYMLGREEYRNVADFYVKDLIEGIVLNKIASTNKYYEDLDAVEKTAILYLYEVTNMVRKSLGYQPLDVSHVRRYLEDLDAAELDPMVCLAIASLLYELGKIKRDRQYILYFYKIVSRIDLDALSAEIIRRKEMSAKAISMYDLDEESVEALSIPIGYIELTLIAKLINALKNEFIYIPIMALSDFVSSYYSIPKSILRLSLWLRSTYYELLKRLGIVLELIISVAVAAVFYMTLLLTVSSVQLAQALGVASFMVSLFVAEVFKRVEQFARSRIARYFDGVKREASEKIEEIKRKRTFFNYFVP